MRVSCGTIITWVQSIVYLKMITVSKVYDSFELCRNLLIFMVDELDRLDWVMFLFEHKNEMQLKKQPTIDDNDFLFIITDDNL